MMRRGSKMRSAGGLGLEVSPFFLLPDWNLSHSSQLNSEQSDGGSGYQWAIRRPWFQHS